MVELLLAKLILPDGHKVVMIRVATEFEYST